MPPLQQRSLSQRQPTQLYITRLRLARARAYLEACGYRDDDPLPVKTLGERHPVPYYARTRRFYHKLGFVALEEFPELWDEDNPCLYMIRDLDEG